MNYEPPLKIWIPIPSDIPKGFGVNSTGKRGGNLRVRCTNSEYDKIQSEAEVIGVSLANFVRWCAIHVAGKLEQHRDAQSTSMSIGNDIELPKRKRGEKRKKANRKPK